MSDVAVAASVAAESPVVEEIKVNMKIVTEKGPCLMCQHSVLSNQPRGMNPEGYYHAACLREDGKCYVCEKPTYNTEVCGCNSLGSYHVECIGKFHNVCYICNENVYETEGHVYNKGKGNCYHKRCIEKVRAKCFECAMPILWKDKRFELHNGVMVHEKCKVKRTPIVKPLLKGQRELLGDCAICAKSVFRDEFREKNDQNQYMHSDCIVNQIPVVEHACTKAFVPQPIDVRARNLVPLFVHPGMPRVEKKAVGKKAVEKDVKKKAVEKKAVEKKDVEKQAVEKKDEIKGVCSFCNKNIFANEERAKNKQGGYYHISCHKRSVLRVEPGISKKALGYSKLKASVAQTIVATKPLPVNTPPLAAIDAAAAVSAVAKSGSFVMSDTFYAQQDHHSRCESTDVVM